MFGAFGKKGVIIQQDGWPCLVVEGAEDYVVPLIFDPIAKRFEGTEEAQDVAPIPGEIRPLQSALTVLVSEFMSKVLRGRP